jgi:hypothetical protein
MTTLTQLVADAIAGRRFRAHETVEIVIDGVLLECDIDEDANLEAVRIGKTDVTDLLGTVAGASGWWTYLDAAIAAQRANDSAGCAIDMGPVYQRVAKRHYEALALQAEALKRAGGL